MKTGKGTGAVWRVERSDYCRRVPHPQRESQKYTSLGVVAADVGGRIAATVGMRSGFVDPP